MAAKKEISLLESVRTGGQCLRSGTFGGCLHQWESFREDKAAAVELGENSEKEACVAAVAVCGVRTGGSESFPFDKIVAVIAIIFARAYGHADKVIREGGMHAETTGVPPAFIGRYHIILRPVCRSCPPVST